MSFKSFKEKLKDVLSNLGLASAPHETESLLKVSAPQPWPAYTEYDLVPAPDGSRVLVVDMSSAEANALKEDLSAQLHRITTSSPVLSASFVKESSDYIQEGFERFHADNPEVFTLLVDLALSAKANGHTRMGAKMLVERVRWHYTVDVKTKEPWRINNSYTALYARKIMQEVPALDGFFNTRTRY